MSITEMLTATRQELQVYLEARGFAVYESEAVEDLRAAAILDAADDDKRPDNLCPFCDGSGLVSNGPVDDDCPDCAGTGGA